MAASIWGPTQAGAGIVLGLTFLNFGAIGDGITDDSDAINRGIAYVKQSGGVIRAPGWPYKWRCKNLRLEGGIRPWGILGDGKYLTYFEHLDGGGNFFAGADGSTVPYFLQGFTVDCKFSTYAAINANNAISIADTSNVRLQDILCKDYKEAGILIYSTTLPNLYENVLVIDCEADGNGVANVGMNIANINNASYIRCRAVNGNKAGAPGFGIQFKDECHNSYMIDCYSEGWAAGFASGHSGVGGINNATNCEVSGCRAINCDNVLSGRWDYSQITVVGDMNDAGQSGVNITHGVGTTVYATIKNLAANKAAIRFEAEVDACVGFVDHMSGWANPAKAAVFDAGCTNSTIVLRKTSDEPAVWAVPDLVTIGSATDGNSFRVEGAITYENCTIASGIVTPANGASTEIRVDTEGGAASDDLDTITPFVGIKEGHLLVVRTIANARDVTVTESGNIRLAAATRVLSHTDDTLLLRWNAFTSLWNETSYSDNTA